MAAKRGNQNPTKSVVLKYKQSKGKEAIKLYNSTTRRAQEWQKNLITNTTFQIWRVVQPANGEETNRTVEQALKPILNEFDENEKMMREISAEIMKLRKEMIPLAAKYKEIELRQQELTEFIESICKIRERKPT